MTDAPVARDNGVRISSQSKERDVEHERAIKGLAEIALQVQDMETMVAFYRDIVNLDLMRRFDHAAFFRIADGVEGHTQMLALFDRIEDDGALRAPQGFRTPPLDHIAFGISLTDYAGERDRLLNLGYDVTETTHGWVGWRSLYVRDPEGNQVEWVCYDVAAEDARS